MSSRRRRTPFPRVVVPWWCGGCLLALATGCELPHYAPPQPPPFLHELASSPAPAQPAETAETRPSLGQPREEAPPPREAPPTLAAPQTGLSLADVVRLTLEGDPKIRAGAEEIP